MTDNHLPTGGAYALVVILVNAALVAAIVGLAHLVGWAGPSYAAGVITGASLFLSWFRLKHGHWP